MLKIVASEGHFGKGDYVDGLEVLLHIESDPTFGVIKHISAILDVLFFLQELRIVLHQQTIQLFCLFSSDFHIYDLDCKRVFYKLNL